MGEGRILKESLEGEKNGPGVQFNGERRPRARRPGVRRGNEETRRVRREE